MACERAYRACPLAEFDWHSRRLRNKIRLSNSRQLRKPLVIQHSSANEPDSDQVEANFARWFAAMEASHAMLMAGLRDQVGPDGDVLQAYREWRVARRARKRKAYQQAAERYEQRNGQSNGSHDAT